MNKIVEMAQQLTGNPNTSVSTLNAVTKDVHRIIETSNELAPRIDEGEFYRTWLLTLHRYHNEEDINLNYWLEVANSPFQEVQLLNPQEEVVGVVPPIFIQPQEYIHNADQMDIGSILARAEMMDKRMPGTGTAFMHSELTQKVLTHDELLLENQKAWDDLFIKYGLAPIYDKRRAAIEAPQSDNPGETEFDDYEEI